MYLVNVNTLELEDFIEGSIPPYAILSHRWGLEELNFKEVLKKRPDKRKKGYRKLVSTSHTAKRYEVGYIWIDTCCIDKRSSAELSEAINSMFSWYEKSKVCLAYLEDVGEAPYNTQLKDSVWFTRAWTLQELLAPYHVEFFDHYWGFIGTKVSLTDELTSVTRVPKDALLKGTELWEFPIAVKMSWASERNATRTEDTAYSLLGIFDVNMPLLYGEGAKAFNRLQEEIIRCSMDRTFLLWKSSEQEPRLLAGSPADFKHLHLNLLYTTHRHDDLSAYVSSLTNAGLEIELPLTRWAMNTYAARIARYPGGDYAVLLRQLPGSSDTVLYRIGTAFLPLKCHIWNSFRKRKVLILRGSRDQRIPELVKKHDNLSGVACGFDVYVAQTMAFQSVFCQPGWSTRKPPSTLQCRFHDSHSTAVASMACRIDSEATLALDLWFDFDSRPCVRIRRDIGTTTDELLTDARVADLRAWKELEQQLQCLGGPASYGSETALVTDERTGGKSYLLRNSGCEPVYCQLPRDFLPAGPEIWVGFIPPSPYAPATKDKSWVFTVSGESLWHLVWDGVMEEHQTAFKELKGLWSWRHSLPATPHEWQNLNRTYYSSV